jgi:hypothetical protein
MKVAFLALSTLPAKRAHAGGESPQLGCSRGSLGTAQDTPDNGDPHSNKANTVTPVHLTLDFELCGFRGDD